MFHYLPCVAGEHSTVHRPPQKKKIHVALCATSVCVQVYAVSPYGRAEAEEVARPPVDAGDVRPRARPSALARAVTFSDRQRAADFTSPPALLPLPRETPLTWVHRRRL